MVPALRVALSLGKVASRSRKCYRECRGPGPVAGSMLPNSTEQAVTTAGIWQPITECVRQTYLVMVGSPQPRRSSTSLVILAGGQERQNTGSNRGSFSHMRPSLCLNPELEALPPEPHTIQGQRAILWPHGPSCPRWQSNSLVFL